MDDEQFFALTPDRVLAAAEVGGMRCTGLCYPLNSLENRVYELEREDRSRVVAKFYRPRRWSEAQILAEHGFLAELLEAEIPVCAPLPFPGGATLRRVEETGILYCVFPKVGGRAPEEFSDEQLVRLGALLARIHTVGAAREAPARVRLTPETYATQSLALLEAQGALPAALRGPFRARVEMLVKLIEPMFQDLAVHRIHGDCHPGNLLWAGAGPFFLDFDDMVTGPPVQDVWMLVPGRDAEAVRQRDVLLVGYESLRGFERPTLRLIEPLRTLRYLHHSAWITRRWSDPSFRRAFPHYGTERYWKDLLADLDDQLERIAQDSPLGVSITRAVAQPAVEVRVCAVGSDEFQRVLMVREEVFAEELGQDPDVVLVDDRAATHLLAVDRDGRALGAATLAGTETHAGRVFQRVVRLAVLAPQRKRGAGRALLERAEQLATERAAPGLVIDARVESLPFFAALGFVALGKPHVAHGMTVRSMVRESRG